MTEDLGNKLNDILMIVEDPKSVVFLQDDFYKSINVFVKTVSVRRRYLIKFSVLPWVKNSIGAYIDIYELYY